MLAKIVQFTYIYYNSMSQNLFYLFHKQVKQWDTKAFHKDLARALEAKNDRCSNGEMAQKGHENHLILTGITKSASQI